MINDTLIGQTLGRYRILEHLGSGGMAEVYKAHHPGLDRYVAVKILHTFLANEENFLARFRREAKAIATLRHPNIVQVFDFDYDEERDLYYMVMEFINGLSLKEKLQDLRRRGEKMSVEEIVRICGALGDALDYAHRRGMVHRDVKPANVIFNSDDQPILTDFGIAKMVNVAKLTASGEMIGTPAYMAPEQALGKVGDERSDIYSLGVMIFQLATGTLPFEADTPIGVALKHINDPLPPLREVEPDVPEKLEEIVSRAMSKDPEERYQTAAQLVADLRQMAPEVEGVSSSLDTVVPSALEDTVAMAQATPALDNPQAVQPTKRGRRRWLLIGLIAVLTAVALGTVALLYRGEFDQLGNGLASLVRTAEPTPSAVPSSPTPPSDETATAVAATAVAVESLQQTLSAPTATPLPDETATAIAACIFEAEVVDDSSVWPSVLTPGQRFIKSWEVENTGTCTWPEDVDLVFASGDELEVLQATPIISLPPGETLRIEVTFKAPGTYGTYTSVWQLEDNSGRRVGERLEVNYRVGATPTPRPTTTPTPTPTPEISPTPRPPLDMTGPIPISCQANPSGGYIGGRICWQATGGPSDDYRYFYGFPGAEQELPGSCNDFTGFPHTQTYFTVSGPGQDWPTPGDCGRGGWGDGGWCRTASGYEVRWIKVFITEDYCP